MEASSGARGQRRLGLGPGLCCLSLAGAPEPQGPPRCTYLLVDQGGGGVGAMGWPRRVGSESERQASLWATLWVGRGMGQEGLL